MKDTPARRPYPSRDGSDALTVQLLGIQGARKRSVLIVDDEPAVRHVLRRYLDRRGWDVSEAGSAEQALDLLANLAVRVDAVIVDLYLPGLSGTALCRRIAAMRPALAARMIVASGDAAAANDALAHEQLHCPVLAKPFELFDLEQALVTMLAS